MIKLLFISECKLNAFKRTSRILNKYCFQLGRRTWFADMSREGLAEVKKALSDASSKHTDMTIHEIKNNGERDLITRIGSKKSFNEDGLFSFSSTATDMLRNPVEKPYLWKLMIEAVKLAGLFHDLGKMNEAFQRKIDPLHASKPSADYLRHEFISYQMLMRIITALRPRDDLDWSQDLSSPDAVADAFAKSIPVEDGVFKEDPIRFIRRHEKTEPYSVLSAVLYIVISHHKQLESLDVNDAKPFMSPISYETLVNGHVDESVKDASTRLVDDKTPVWENATWCKRVADSCRIIYHILLEHGLVGKDVSSAWYTLFTQTGRAAMVMSDHKVSALKTLAPAPNESLYYANSVERDDGTRGMGQTLDDHLIGVGKMGGDFSRRFFSFHNHQHVNVVQTDDIPPFIKQSVPITSPFAWQSDAVRKIKKAKVNGGFIGLLIAGTGKGKTVAYTKCMSAFGDLRFNLALGLRSLTLQSGDAYRDVIGFDKQQVTTIIGSEAARRLHDDYNEKKAEASRSGTEAAMNDDLESFYLDTDIQGRKEDPMFSAVSHKMRQMMASPILISTVDYLIPSVESRRTSQCSIQARIASSDLILDEIDEYSPNDLVVLNRLVYLTGFYGRKVILSSATLPPSISESMVDAYMRGYHHYCLIHNKPYEMHVGWLSHEVDVTCVKKYSTLAKFPAFKAHNEAIIQQLISIMDAENAKRKACVLNISDVGQQLPKVKPLLQHAYAEHLAPVFDCIREQADELHTAWRQVDPVSRKNISVGAIRFSTVKMARAYTRYAVNQESLALDSSRQRFYLCYHAKHATLARHEIEKWLDSALKGHDDPGARSLFKDPRVRAILDTRTRNDVRDVELIIVTTSIEEVGRDHDFDWIVTEPSSTRSIIQMAGRLRRHRHVDPFADNDVANFAIMDTPLRSILNHITDGRTPPFSYPGVETQAGYRISDLVPNGGEMTERALDVLAWEAKIDARLMLSEAGVERSPLTQLEHRFYRDLLNTERQDTPAGAYLDDANLKLHNKAILDHPFRGKRQPSDYVYYNPDEDRFYKLYVENKYNQFEVPCESNVNIRPLANADHLIFELDYAQLLSASSFDRETNRAQLFQMFLGFDVQGYKDQILKIDFDFNLGFSSE